MKEILDMLLAIIAEKGPKYPEKNPYSTYQTLLKQGADAKKARLILLTLAANIPEKAQGMSQEELSKVIQEECCLKSKPAESLATMYTKLYSPAQRTAWDSQKEGGFRAFCEGSWTLKWDGKDVWYHDGDEMNCYADAKATFGVADEALARKQVASLLRKNPFADAKDIWNHFTKMLKECMDEDLSDYVIPEGYYPPAMDGYSPEDALQKYCKEIGLKLLSISCEGAIDYE